MFGVNPTAAPSSGSPASAPRECRASRSLAPPSSQKPVSRASCASSAPTAGELIHFAGDAVAGAHDVACLLISTASKTTHLGPAGEFLPHHSRLAFAQLSPGRHRRQRDHLPPCRSRLLPKLRCLRSVRLLRQRPLLPRSHHALRHRRPQPQTPLCRLLPLLPPQRQLASPPPLAQTRLPNLQIPPPPNNLLSLHSLTGVRADWHFRRMQKGKERTLHALAGGSGVM